MQAALDQFRINISYVRNLGAIHKALYAQTTSILDLSDILRAELVMAVSAFDKYIHDVVRIGMLEEYQGKRTSTKSFQLFSISLGSAQLGILTPKNIDWLDDEIRNRHSWQSFQRADKIADAMHLISDVKLWDETAKKMGKNAGSVKTQLNLIVDRRNCIAHEADIDPSYTGSRWPINEAMVDSAIDFIEEVANSIYTLLKL
jgi:hypothetical protein